MTIKQSGGIFGRNPTFNDVTVENSLDVSQQITSSGYSSVTDVSSSDNGELILGKNTSYQAKISYDGNSFGRLYIDNTWSSPTAYIIFRQQTSTSPVEMGRFNSNGLAFPSGKGIDFSATSGTGTSELFDDYEEGTWTPTGCGAGAVGVYTKMGDTVFAYCEVKANSVSTNTIGGLPFTVGSGNSAIGGYFGRARFAGIFDANGNEVRIRMLGTDIKFMNNGGLSGDAATTITTAGGGIVQLAISVIYKV